MHKNKYLLDKSKNDFWCKKFEKCRIKIKKTKPTPKSITHKKPTNISPSSVSSKKPKDIKYIPAIYHKVIILIVLIKNIKENEIRIWIKKSSFNT